MFAETSAQTFFFRMGSQVNEMWRQKEYDETAFSSIALRAMQETPPSQQLSFWDAVKFAFLQEPLPMQTDIEATFAQPPLTVYWQSDFRIELLFWVVGLPGIHQHAFSGAFHLLCGSSLHSRWVFEEREHLESRLLLGNIRSMEAELLRRGDTREITAGSNFIHATYHLDRPSVSVVIRTNQEYGHLPQYSYLPPSIAFASREAGPEVRRRSQMLKMMALAGRQKELIEIVLHFLEVADPFSAFHAIFDSYLLLPNETDRSRILTGGMRRHPRLVEAIKPALRFEERRERISKLRKRVTNSDLQFFLALLLNLPDRRSILDLVRARHRRANAVGLIMAWLRELSNLGLLETRFTPAQLHVIRELISGKTHNEIMQTTVNWCSAHGGTEPDQESLQRVIQALQCYWLLQPLLACDEGVNTSAQTRAQTDEYEPR